jgi:hypothetical protein
MKYILSAVICLALCSTSLAGVRVSVCGPVQPDQVRVGVIRPDQVKPDQAKPDQVKQKRVIKVEVKKEGVREINRTWRWDFRLFKFVVNK